MYEVQRLCPRHFQILELSLTGLTNREIGATVGVTPETVNAILSSPLGQAEIARRRSEQSKKFDNSALEIVEGAKRKVAMASTLAADTMIGLLESDDDSIKHRSAKDLLDRAFGKSDEKIGQSVTVLNPDKLSILILAMQEVRGSGPPKADVLGIESTAVEGSA